MSTHECLWARYGSRYSDWLRAGSSGDWIPVGAIFSAPVQTGPVAHPASCTMGTESFPGVKSGRGVTLTPHPLLLLWSRKSIAIPLLPLQAIRPVQRLSAYIRVHFTLPFTQECSQLWVWELNSHTSFIHRHQNGRCVYHTACIKMWLQMLSGS